MLHSIFMGLFYSYEYEVFDEIMNNYKDVLSFFKSLNNDKLSLDILQNEIANFKGDISRYYSDCEPTNDFYDSFLKIEQATYKMFNK